LQQEEIANLAELVMDGAFVTIVGDDGKINIDEVRRLADTKPTISRFAALASAIMDAFTIIPGMTKKARGLNDAQVAALRKFADNPKELASPRTRNVAQQLIAQSLVKMMDAKRGNIPAGEIGASPMSDELAGARIPALDFSIRLAMPDGGEPAFDEAAVARAKLESMGEEESINFSIRRAPETAEFQRWFGDSKVVNPDGSPMVVYHGTRAARDFGEFKVTKDLGFHFASTPEAANRALTTRVGGVSQAGGARIYPVYLSIKNPLRVEETGSMMMGDLGGWNFSDLVMQFNYLLRTKQSDLFRYEPESNEFDVPDGMDIGEAMRAGAITQTQPRPGLIDETPLGYVQRINKEFYDQFGRINSRADKMRQNQMKLQRFVADLKRLGYDGMVYRNVVEGGGDSWIAFDANQIKSVLNQRPTESPNISFAIRRIPQEVIDTAGVENSIEAAKSQKFKSIRDFKLVIQKQVRDAATRNNTTIHDRDSAVIDE
jgi:hypothetical protein